MNTTFLNRAKMLLNEKIHKTRTPFGKEVKLNNKEVLNTGKDDETYIKINEDTGIEIFTLKPFNFFTDETLDVSSTGKMTIHSVDDMSIITDANLTIVAKNIFG